MYRAAWADKVKQLAALRKTLQLKLFTVFTCVVLKIMNMTSPLSEFVFVPVKSSMRPEDGESVEGKAFLDIFTKVKSPFSSLILGRSIDFPEYIGIGAGTYNYNPALDLS